MPPTQGYDVFKSYILARLKELDISRGELARRMGVKPSSVYNWFDERNSTPSPQALIAMAEVLGLDAIYLCWLLGYLPEKYHNEAALINSVAIARTQLRVLRGMTQALLEVEDCTLKLTDS